MRNNLRNSIEFSVDSERRQKHIFCQSGFVGSYLTCFLSCISRRPWLLFLIQCPLVNKQLLFSCQHVPRIQVTPGLSHRLVEMLVGFWQMLTYTHEQYTCWGGYSDIIP